MLVIFTLEHCPQCKLLKKYLVSKGIEFEEKDAQENAQFLMTQGFMAAPVIDLDGQMIPFISIKQIEILLKTSGYL